MVRLKAGAAQGTLSGNVTFQFQNGAIKRLQDLDEHHPKKSFNSKMVRLKVFNHLTLLLRSNAFNSKMVRLKEMLRVYSCLYQ